MNTALFDWWVSIQLDGLSFNDYFDVRISSLPQLNTMIINRYWLRKNYIHGKIEI